MKKIIAMSLAGILSVSMLAGCAETEKVRTRIAKEDRVNTNSSELADDINVVINGVDYKIGICQFVQHDALDAATQGFKDALTKEFGESVTFDEQIAQNDPAICLSIANDFVDDNVDLILANATPALQAAKEKTDTTPIIGTSITDYKTALDLAYFDGTVGGNISGTSDLAPLDGQAEMIHELYPDIKNIGFLYCSAEENSQFQVDTIKGFLDEYGYACEYYSFQDTNDLATVCTSAVNECELIYVPTDNTVAANTDMIQKISLPSKTPVITGEENICKGCGVASLSIDYYDLGYHSGRMAIRVLKGEDISKMPIEYAPKFIKKYNPANCRALGLTIPVGYEAIEME